MNGLLAEATDKFGLRLASINGGSLRNAIPRESFSVVVIPAESKDDFLGFVSTYAIAQQDVFKDADPGLEIDVEESDMAGSLIDEKTTFGLYKAVESHREVDLVLIRSFSLMAPLSEYFQNISPK